MNVNTGKIYPDHDTAVREGNQPEELVTGHLSALQKLSALARGAAQPRAKLKRIKARKAAKRALQAKSRRRNRR